jgi:hypothetical protein
MNTALIAIVCVGVAACTCPGPASAHAAASRAQYAAGIDACLKMDIDCEALCRAVFSLPAGDSIDKCVVTSESSDGVELDVVYVTPCGPD